MNIFTDVPSSVNGETPKRSYNRVTWQQMVFDKNTELLEHMVMLCTLKSFNFYSSMKSRLCPVSGVHLHRRPDFSRPDFNYIFGFAADYWDTLVPGGVQGDLSIGPDTIDLIFAKKFEKNLILGEDAKHILTWLKEDIKTIDIDAALLASLPENPFLATWLEQRAADYEYRRLSSLNRPPTLEDWKTSIKVIENASSPPMARNFFDPKADAADELLGPGRYLCRKGGALLIAQTGVGKSVFACQAATAWACGRSQFGIRPAKPLKIVMIQAENDDGDLDEFREGALHHLKLTEAELTLAKENFLVITETARTGAAFLNQVVAPALDRYKPDLLLIDPALSFLGGEAASQEAVGKFLRNNLNPLLSDHNCGVLMVSHTAKPSVDRESWKNDDFAYSAFGSVEWSNWARAILVLRSTKTENVYELRAAKRGARLGWKDEEGKPTFCLFLEKSRETDKYYWSQTEEPGNETDDKVLAILAVNGPKTADWQHAVKVKLDLSRASFYRSLKRLCKKHRIVESPDGTGWIQVNPGVNGEVGGGHFQKQSQQSQS